MNLPENEQLSIQSLSRVFSDKNKETDNSRNGHSKKTLRTSMGKVDIEVPRDRNGEFEPKILPKNQTSISQDNWTLVDFYIDTGAKAPRMENAKEWCRLLNDCFSGKIDLIVTQKLGNVSSDPDELAFLARILATQKHPIGMYFISEDIFTLDKMHFLFHGVEVL